MSETLTPDYLSIDYSTAIQRIKDQLSSSDIFADYNYEGSNIAILIELVAYMIELNTYYTNKIAKNIHIETADIYEAVNRGARQMGYEPQGPIGSRATVTVTVTGATVGSTYRIYPFTEIECPTLQDDDGNTIVFATTSTTSHTATAGTFSVDINCKQGQVTSLTGYDGDDLVDNELILPSNYAYDNDIDDDYPSVSVTVGGDEWSRITDFYDELSALYTVDDVYMFVYDRYERSKLVFNSSRNVPTADDDIEITALVTLGADGDVAAGTITSPETNFVYDVDAGSYVNNSQITVTNANASTGGADAEDTDSIKENAKAALHTQYRNVTSSDYISHLEERSDITVANAWGEQEIAPSGSINNYNKVHLSVIPTTWGNSTIGRTTNTFTVSWGSSASETIYSPSGISSTWENTLSDYLEPRKMISAYEEWELPELVYFSFDIGIRKKRTYSFSNIRTDILNKLIYWFRAANREFNEIINFNDITEYLLDTTEISSTDDFEYIEGIRNLNIRDIDVSTTIYEYNTEGNYPYYVDLSTTWKGENQLRRIQLGHDQFPVLSSSTVRISEES